MCWTTFLDWIISNSLTQYMVSMSIEKLTFCCTRRLAPSLLTASLSNIFTDFVRQSDSCSLDSPRHNWKHVPHACPMSNLSSHENELIWVSLPNHPFWLQACRLQLYSCSYCRRNWNSQCRRWCRVCGYWILDTGFWMCQLSSCVTGPYPSILAPHLCEHHGIVL